MSDFIARLVYGSILLAISGLIVMLTEGALAGDFGWRTLSYGQALLAVLGLGAVIGYGVGSVTYALSVAGVKRQ